MALKPPRRTLGRPFREVKDYALPVRRGSFTLTWIQRIVLSGHLVDDRAEDEEDEIAGVVVNDASDSDPTLKRGIWRPDRTGYSEGVSRDRMTRETATGGGLPSVDVSVVIIALNEAARLRQTVEQARASLPANSEILVIDDGSTDGSSDFLATADATTRLIRTERIGVARARNLGARQARGRFLFFADAHLTMEPGCWEPMLEVLAQPMVGGVAPGIVDLEHPEYTGYGIRFRGPDLILKWLDRQSDDPYQVPLVPWCCGGMRRDVFEATSGFDEGMIRWGMVDNEMSLRLWLEGYELRVVPQARVAHLFREEFPFKLQWSWFLHNTLRLAFLHFDVSRIERVVEELRSHREFSAGLAMVMTDNLFSRREELKARRTRDSRWYFDQFPADW